MFIFISNISNLKQKKKIASANGTFCQIINKIEDLNIIEIILPSKKKKKINSFFLTFIGKNLNLNWKYSIGGNFGYNFKLNIRQIVRGVAKNPVDHPHGGRTKTNKPEVSPWGWITKHSH